MKTPSALLLSLSAALLVSTSALGQNYDERSVHERSERLISAWNEHDMTAFADLFAPRAQFVNVVGIWWKSRAEIEAAHEATHKTMFKDSVLSARIASMTWLRTDVAAVHLAWELKGAKDPSGNAVPTRKGIMLLVFTREQKQWLVQVAQNTDIIEGVLAPPAPSAPR
ncbi:MAG TPA: SgcJ/EcaC family oxidoreductase [Myxococcaceae bacterium]|nr:SgcJ/EcaC family oxidoreductase [Myxococcaceae bacterium]